MNKMNAHLMYGLIIIGIRYSAVHKSSSSSSSDLCASEFGWADRHSFCFSSQNEVNVCKWLCKRFDAMSFIGTAFGCSENSIGFSWLFRKKQQHP